jgi:hypothetical protein
MLLKITSPTARNDGFGASLRGLEQTEAISCGLKKHISALLVIDYQLDMCLFAFNSFCFQSSNKIALIFSFSGF